ncbi:MAG TPA: sulfate permease [Phycisphaerales bacterium]|nr:sulfate permease [Phycisphaerales bacterium]
MMAQKKSQLCHCRFVRSLLPIATWLPNYKQDWLRADIIAGLAIWAMTVPQALGYAGIANVPPVYALYTVPLAMVAYAFFGTSRTLCVGPESAIAIISAATVGTLAAGDPGRFLALTSLLALIVGGLFLLFGLLRLGWVANFLGRPVLQGFTQGIALTVIISQIPLLFGTQGAFTEMVSQTRNLPQLIGLEFSYVGIFQQTRSIVATIGQTNLPTMALGLPCLVFLFVFRRFKPFAPSALFAVILTVLAVHLFGLTEHGVVVMGEVETGSNFLAIPMINISDVLSLLPGAFAIALLGYSISLSIAAVGAQKTGETIDANQELVALGMSNLGAAFSSGFVVCGSLSRGSVILRAGGRNQIVSLVNAGLVTLTLFFALPFFFKLPKATLGAIVIVAMYGLLDFGYLRQLYRVSRGEFMCAIAALLGVLLLGILNGVAVGVILALAVLIHRVSHPGSAVLGKLPGTDTYRDIIVHPEVETVPGLLIFRFDAPIIFPNAGYFTGQVKRLINEATMPVREVLIPAQQINLIDSTGADQLAKLQAELEEKDIKLSFAEAKDALRKTMHSTGLEAKVGTDHFYESIEDGVQVFLQHSDPQTDET